MKLDHDPIITARSPIMLYYMYKRIVYLGTYSATTSVRLYELDSYERRGFYYYCSLSVYQGHWVQSVYRSDRSNQISLSAVVITTPRPGPEHDLSNGMCEFSYCFWIFFHSITILLCQKLFSPHKNVCIVKFIRTDRTVYTAAGMIKYITTEKI